MPYRPDFWGIPQWAIALMYVVLCAAVLATVAQLWAQMRLWRVGRPEPRFDNLLLRFARLIKYGVAQVKIANEAYAGVMHLSIFWAMVVLYRSLQISNGSFPFRSWLLPCRSPKLFVSE